MSNRDARKESGQRVHGAAIEAAQRSRADAGTAAEQAEVIDFKMVTFSLGGKDYGIDIMNVKEIAKFYHFTYVPNAPAFVRGVYNLRGEIISIIDLRLMFNLPIEHKDDDQPEEGLIVRLEDKLLGVVVDNVDRVVGISSEAIQPPHPIFSDINLSYISGIVEYHERLYIILDAARIFSPEDRPEAADISQGQLDQRPGGVSELQSTAHEATPRFPGEPTGDTGEIQPGGGAGELSSEPAFGFIRETLATFVNFHVTDINEEWVSKRFEEWKAHRSAENKDVQLKVKEDAEAFLAPFYSPYTGTFWSEQYIQRFSSMLPAGTQVSSFTAWSIGGGSGYETYSLTVMLRQAFPEARLKVWSNDNDLLSISSAPNLVFQAESVPESFEPYIVSGKNGYSFSQAIRDLIVFEYHDILNQNAIPEVDLIVARDVLSFLESSQQQAALTKFTEKARVGTLLVLGENERLHSSATWEPVSGGLPGTYQKSE